LAHALNGKIPFAFASLLLGAAMAAPARAQTSPAPPAATNAATLQDLAKDAKNPVINSIKVPIQYTSGFDVGAHHNVGGSLNIQPVLPLPLSADWTLIARPSLNVTYAPSPHEQFGLQDLQTSFFLTPTSASTWLWGVGPTFQFPSATSKELGTGRWSAGPTAAAVYSQGPWFNAILTYQLLSFAGNRNRGSVNQTYIEPLVSYNFESGWSLQCDPAITYDWTADIVDAWDLPLGADVGKTIQVGARALSLQVGAYDYLKYPQGAPQWIVRTQITLAFPQGN
jgi:hypothetical protein